jgi:biopolymer transport protein ExbD
MIRFGLDRPLGVAIAHAGFVIRAHDGFFGPNCGASVRKEVIALPRLASGALDMTGFKGCVVRLKSLSPNDSALELSADPDIRYEELVAVMDAARGDHGELFPEPRFETPHGVDSTIEGPDSTPPPCAGRAPTAPVPSTGKKPPEEEEGVVILLSKTKLQVGDDDKPIAEYSDLTAIAKEGLPASIKFGGANGLFIEPLARSLSKHRDLDCQLRAAKGEDASSSQAILVADASIPYRLFYEVMNTAKRSGFGRFHLMARVGAKK